MPTSRPRSKFAGEITVLRTTIKRHRLVQGIRVQELQDAGQRDHRQSVTSARDRIGIAIDPCGREEFVPSKKKKRKQLSAMTVAFQKELEADSREVGKTADWHPGIEKPKKEKKRKRSLSVESITGTN